MHTISIYIDEDVNSWERVDICETLIDEPHVTNVELSEQHPHELLVEYEERYNVPLHVIDVINSHGLHADIVSA